MNKENAELLIAQAVQPVLLMLEDPKYKKLHEKLTVIKNKLFRAAAVLHRSSVVKSNRMEALSGFGYAGILPEQASALFRVID